MARGQLSWLAGLGATLALMTAACTKINPDYCADAEHFQCSALDAGADEPERDAVDGVEAMGDQSLGDGAEAAETATDGAEAGDGGDADVVPGCTNTPPSCASNTDGKTICDSTTHACRGCRADDECRGTDDAGICLAARCVSKKDVILVDSLFNPCVSMSTTPGAHFCDMAGALMQARVDSDRRRIIVVANTQGPWTDNLAPAMDPKVVTVVGLKTARFLASTTSPGITLTGVEMVLRGIQVDGSAQTPGIVVNGGAIATLEQVRVGNAAIGVQAEGATRITIERSLLLNNGVGLSLNGAEFSVRNTVIANSASIGAKLALPSMAGKTMRFQNNTLIDNQMPLICSAGMTISALLISPPTAALPCSPPNSPVIEDPMFDSAEPYHLTLDSPCHNAGDAVDFPDVDIDGDPRPMGKRSDCGADEFRE